MKTRASLMSAAIAASTALLLQGCGGTTVGNPILTEDTSASGAAASAVGGALSGSSGSGTQASLLRLLDLLVPNALASVSCPTFKTAQGAGCVASGGTMWLSYAACSFGTSAATWTGTQALILSSGTAACGSFPVPSGGGTLTRQFVSGASSTVPGSLVHTSSFGTKTTIDDAAADLGNFDGDPIAKIANGGYGSQISFGASGARTGVVIGHHVSGTGYDHSISGNLSVSEAAGATSRVISGAISVYHNGLRLIGTSTFNNVTHTDGCCLPTSGSITTSFSAGAHVAPTLLGQKAVGKTETLTFTGCGTGTFVGVDGTTTDVSLSRCF